MKLSPETRATTVESLANLLTEQHAFPEAGQEMADRIQGRLAQGDYDEIVDVETFETADAEIGIFAYGSCARSARRAMTLAREKGLKVGKLNVDDNQRTAMSFRVMSIPTVILFKDGEIAGRHTGALVQKSKLEAWINSTVSRINCSHSGSTLSRTL